MKAKKPRLERLKAAKVPGHRPRLRQLPGAAEALNPDPEPVFENDEDVVEELDSTIFKDIRSKGD